MALPGSIHDREYQKFTTDGAGDTAVRVVGSLSSSSGPEFTSFTKTALFNVTNVAQELTAVANQVGIRLVPVAAGNFAYGPDSTVTAATAENFTQNSPITLNTNASVWVIRSAASGVSNFIVYRFIKV